MGDLLFEVRLQGEWQSFDAASASKLARDFTAGKTTSRLQRSGQTYDIDFRRLSQKNVKSGTTRPLRVTSLTGHVDRNEVRGEILVTALEGRNLKNMDLGAMDPYLRVMLGPSTVKSKAVQKGGSNPVWTGDLGASPPVGWVDEKILHLEVWDEDTGTIAEMFSSQDDFVGKCMVHVPFLARQPEGAFEGWLPVYRGNGIKPHGELKVRIVCKGIPDTDLGGVVQQLKVVPARVWRHHMHGIVHILEGESLAMFKAYAIALHGVADRFGDLKCDNYDAEHAVIFNTSSPQGLALRTSFAANHMMLFKDGCSNGQTFDMKSVKDFLFMMKGGLRENLRRVYTYVIVDHGMFFTETGLQHGKDLLSKHVILADVAPAVRSAGTFRICLDPSTTPATAVLVFDNDSGTYRPSGEVLEPVADVLKANIPGLVVRGLNVLEEQPEETKRFVGPREDKDDGKAVYKGQWRWRYDSVPVSL